MTNRKHTFALTVINPLNAKLNSISQLLALLGAHHILHVSRMRVKKIVSPFVGTGSLISYPKGHTK